MKLRWLGLVVALGLIGVRAQAAPADSSVAEARKHFEEGSKAYNLGEFNQAVTEYKAAYNAKPDPVFLYNIAQAYRLAGDLPQALFFYRSFLRNEPRSPNRKEVEERIKQLEVQIAQQKEISTAPPTSAVAPGTLKPTTPEPTPVPTPAPATKAEPAPAATVTTPAAPATGADLTTSAPKKSDKPVYKKGWFWGVVAGAVVAVGLGVGLGVGLTRGAEVPSTDIGNQKVSFGLAVAPSVGGAR